MNTVRHGLAALVLAALASTAGARDNTTAEAAFARNDHAALLKELLPAYNRGELQDGRALYLLSRACYFQQHSVRSMFDRSALCNNRTGAITKAAADAGSVDAMLDLAYTLDSPMRELRHPDLPQNRMQAHHYALAAAEHATTPEQRERATKAVADIEARIPASQRKQATATASSGAPTQPAAAGTASGAGGSLPWLDAAALGRRQQFTLAPDRSGIDPDSIVRNGDRIQYINNDSDDFDLFAVLVQGRCSDGKPAIAWAAEHSGRGTTWGLDPANVTLDLDAESVSHFTSLTRKACSIRR